MYLAEKVFTGFGKIFLFHFLEFISEVLRCFNYVAVFSFDLKPGCSVELTGLGSEFMASLFHKHDRDRDGALSPHELMDLFDVCPRNNPWGMDVFHSVTTNNKGWIDLNGFLCQWRSAAILYHTMPICQVLYDPSTINYISEFDQRFHSAP